MPEHVSIITHSNGGGDLQLGATKNTQEWLTHYSVAFLIAI